MDFRLDEDQQLLQQTVRQWATDRVAPQAEENDRLHRYPAELVKEMSEMGLMGMVVRGWREDDEADLSALFVLTITGAWVALRLATNKLLKAGDVISDPLVDPVAAVSCGIYAGQPVLDLDYPEDSEAGVDGNFIMTGSGKLIEVQMSAEGSVFSRTQMDQLMDLAEKGVAELAAAQKAATA